MPATAIHPQSLLLSHHDFAHCSLTHPTLVPPDSPPSSVATTERPQSTPPRSGPGLLTPHPTNGPVPKPIMNIPGAFPPSPPNERHGHAALKHSTDTNNTATDISHHPESPMPPTSPASDANVQSSPSRRPPVVRRLFSLTSLRQSFSSSRTSLSFSQSQRPDSSPGGFIQRAESPSTTATAAPTATASSFLSSAENNRPGTSASLRKKRSSNWFKRKSGFFTTTDDLDVLSEDGPEHKRFKDAPSLPVLPEISTLSGGEMDGGTIGWDEHVF